MEKFILTPATGKTFQLIVPVEFITIELAEELKNKVAAILSDLVPNADITWEGTESDPFKKLIISGHDVKVEFNEDLIAWIVTISEITELAWKPFINFNEDEQTK